MGPGTTELTRMPSPPSSPASVRARLSSAAFVAAYGPRRGRLRRLAVHHDDRAVVGRGQERCRGRRHVHRAQHVHLECLAPRLGVGFRRERPRPEGERVDHDDVEPPEGLVRDARERVRLRVVGDVGRHDDGPAARGLDLRRHRVERFHLPGRERDVRALAREGQRDGTAEPRADPGDDRDFAVEQTHGGRPYCAAAHAHDEPRQQGQGGRGGDRE
jgi:hypothetical protein